MIKKIKANILTYLFQDWLDNDADIEGLQATRNIINNREDALSKVVAGKGMYSTSKSGVKQACNEVEDALTFEVFVEGEDDVRGWQSREQIDIILKENNG